MKSCSNPHLRVWISSVLLVVNYLSVQGQDIFTPLSQEKKLRLSAVKTTETIRVDGRLDESSWLQCPVAGNFKVSYPNQGSNASNQTEVRVLYDATTLYIGAVCHQQDGKKSLQVVDMRRDFIYSDNEHFLVVIDPFGDVRMPVQSFWVTPYGNQTDMMIYDDRIFDYDYDAVWKSKCTVQDSSWTVELAIPFSSIRYPGDSATWSINFTRNNKNTGEFSGWSLWPLAYNPSRMAYAGLLTGIHPPKPKVNLRFQPYMLINSTSGTDKTSKTKPQIGGEIKWAVNTKTVIDATINTDFAQADVDRQVVNLNRSSIFFPEKRQFFLENAKLFSVGQDGIIQPFITRKMGLNEYGSPISINAGLRLVSQSSKQSAGAMLIKQGNDSITSSAWFGITRYTRNIGNNFQIGGMGIIKYNEKQGQVKANMNPVAVVDGFWRISQPFYVRSMISYSTNSDTKSNGMAALTELNYTSNRIIAGLFETYVTKSYSVQTGYTAREDFINTQPSLSLFFRKKWFPKKIAQAGPQVTADIFHTASNGKFQEATLNISPVFLYFKNNMRLSFNIISSWQFITSEFIPVPEINITPGNYNFTRYEIYCRSNQAAHLSTDSRISTGKYYNGSLNSVVTAIRYSPSPHVSMTIGYTRNEFKNVDTVRKYVSTHLLAPEFKLAFTPDIQLSCFYQYNTIIKRGATNVRFSWQYKPLSYFFIVYNDLRSIQNSNFATPFRQQTCIIKFSYIKQI